MTRRPLSPVVVCLLTVFVGIAAPAPAQGPHVGPGDFDVLPLSPDVFQADHLIPAANDRGDVFVVWESKRSDTQQVQIEGVLLLRDDNGSGPRFQHQGNLVLGDPTFNLWRTSSWIGSKATAEDDCVKPHVSAVGRNFVVSWTRMNRTSAQKPYVVETVLVQPDGPNGPRVMRPEPRRGFITWDPSQPSRDYIAGDSGANIATCWLQSRPGGPDQIAFIHVSQTREEERTHAVLNEFHIYGWQVDYNGFDDAGWTRPVTWPLTNADSGRNPLVEGVRNDEVGDYTIGGRMPLFLFETRYGALVMAHEVMESKSRRGVNQDLGRIVLRSFVESGPPGALTQVSTQRVESWRGPSRYHRRPNVACDRDGNTDTHVLAYLEVDIEVGGDGVRDSLAGLARFDVGPDHLIRRVVRDQAIPDPSALTYDARSLLEVDRNPALGVFVAVNPEATDHFEIFAWNAVTRQLDTEYVPQPSGSQTLYKPRRPLAVRSLGDVTVIAFDARLSASGKERPLVYIRAE